MSTDQNHKTMVSSTPGAPALSAWWEAWQDELLVYNTDQHGILTHISPSVQHLLGCSPDEIVGRPIGKLLDLDDASLNLLDKNTHQIAKNLSSQQTHFASRLRPDGKKIHLALFKCKLFDAQGNVVGTRAVGFDLTNRLNEELTLQRSEQQYRRLKEDLEVRVAERTAELQRINEMLLESEARYRSVVEDQTEFIARWLPGGTYTFVNEAYCRYVERSREELVGSTFIPTIHEEDRTRVEQEIASLTPEHPSVTSEHRVYRADGSIGWNHWTNRALFDSADRVEEYQSVGRDVTELKNAADTIREKEAHLVHVSRLATMGELVAGIAHEVHQPLHAAKIFAEAARRNLETSMPDGVSTAIDCMNEISDAVTRTAKIIRHLRAFTESTPVRFESINLNCVAREAAEIIAYEVRRTNVKLHWELAEDLPLVEGDQVQLEQVCVNLLMNACDAMIHSPIEDRRLLIQTFHDENYVTISYCDSGCGLGETDPNRLFDAFFTTKQQGMGMGLSLCKTIADAHDANIWAEDNDGPGLSLNFALPKPKRIDL